MYTFASPSLGYTYIYCYRTSLSRTYRRSAACTSQRALYNTRGTQRTYFPRPCPLGMLYSFAVEAGPLQKKKNSAGVVFSLSTAMKNRHKESRGFRVIWNIWLCSIIIFRSMQNKRVLYLIRAQRIKIKCILREIYFVIIFCQTQYDLKIKMDHT